VTTLRLAIAALVLGMVLGWPPGTGTAWAFGSGATTLDDVAVLAPLPDDPVIVEAVSRLRSELGVIGVTSHLAACTDDVAVDARACDEARAARAAGAGAVTPPGSGVPPGAASPAGEAATPPRGRPSAIISLAREDGVVTIEVIERLPNGSRFFRLVYVPARDGGKDPAVLAVRGVELLRDLQMDVERGAAALPVAPSRADGAATVPEPPPESEHEPDPERDTDLDRPPRPDGPQAGRGPWRISVAWTGLWGRKGLESGFLSVVPALGGAWMARPALAVFLVAAGPFRQDFHTVSGTASSRQELAFAGARVELPWRRIRPFGAAGLGVLHVLAEGRTAVGAGTPISSAVWAPMLTAGAGVALRVGRLLDVFVQADTLWSAPAATLTVGPNEVVGEAGAPSVLGQVGIWLALP
jgi:hypothetical protein